jgi:hypothetical protein
MSDVSNESADPPHGNDVDTGTEGTSGATSVAGPAEPIWRPVFEDPVLSRPPTLEACGVPEPGHRS